MACHRNLPGGLLHHDSIHRTTERALARRRQRRRAESSPPRGRAASTRGASASSGTTCSGARRSFPSSRGGVEAEFEGVEFVGFDAFGSTFGGDEHAVVEALPSRLRDLGGRRGHFRRRRLRRLHARRDAGERGGRAMRGAIGVARLRRLHRTGLDSSPAGWASASCPSRASRVTSTARATRNWPRGSAA